MIKPTYSIALGVDELWDLKIVNALLLGEAASARIAIGKWIGNKDEGFFITLDKILDHKLQDNDETITWNTTIQVLAYTSPKWIVDLDLIKVQP